MGKRDRQRAQESGMVFRNGQLVPMEEAAKKHKAAEEITKALDFAGVPRVSIAERVAKIKKSMEG